MCSTYLTSVLFLATIVVGFATPIRSVDGIGPLMRSLRNAHQETHRIQKRQNSACINAIQEASSPQFIQCSDLFGDATDLSLQQLLSFCQTDNCVPLLIKVFTDLRSCGNDPDGNSTVSSNVISIS